MVVETCVKTEYGHLRQQKFDKMKEEKYSINYYKNLLLQDLETTKDLQGVVQMKKMTSFYPEILLNEHDVLTKGVVHGWWTRILYENLGSELYRAV